MGAIEREGLIGVEVLRHMRQKYALMALEEKIRNWFEADCNVCID